MVVDNFICFHFLLPYTQVYCNRFWSKCTIQANLRKTNQPNGPLPVGDSHGQHFNNVLGNRLKNSVRHKKNECQIKEIQKKHLALIEINRRKRNQHMLSWLAVPWKFNQRPGAINLQPIKTRLINASKTLADSKEKVPISFVLDLYLGSEPLAVMCF